MLNDLIFAATITAPIFCMLALGILFKRIGWVIEEFAKIGSDLVFRVTLPCLLFVKLVETDFRHELPFKLVGIGIGLRGPGLGVLYLMSSSPTAAASYPMTQALGGNRYPEAAITASTSLGSMLFTTLGIFLLRSFQLI